MSYWWTKETASALVIVVVYRSPVIGLSWTTNSCRVYVCIAASVSSTRFPADFWLRPNIVNCPSVALGNLTSGAAAASCNLQAYERGLSHVSSAAAQKVERHGVEGDGAVLNPSPMRPTLWELHSFEYGCIIEERIILTRCLLSCGFGLFKRFISSSTFPPFRQDTITCFGHIISWRQSWLNEAVFMCKLPMTTTAQALRINTCPRTDT